MSEIEENKVTIVGKDIVVFNKKVKNEKIEIFIYEDHKFEDYVSKITNFIFGWATVKRTHKVL